MTSVQIALAAEVERLRAELATFREAVGMLTTLAPHMEIDPCDPLGTAQQIVATVRAELATRDAKPDCRTCDHCSPDYVCRLTRQISPIVCINGDAYIETSPVRLYEMGGA